MNLASHKRFAWRVLPYVSLLIFSPSLFGAPYSTAPESSLTLPRGDGAFALTFSYQESQDFFDHSGNRLPSSDSSFPDGVSEKFRDFRATIGSGYGLTDAFTLWLSLPVVWREEVQSLDAEDWGLGDVRAGARYRFWQSNAKTWETAFEFAAKFPSGDSDIYFADPSRGKKSELPLGSGNTDITPRVLLKTFLLNRRVSALLSASYTFRFNALVEFLRTPSILQDAGDGILAFLPLGNLTIDWGDEVDVETIFSGRLWSWCSLGVGLHYFYRQSTKLDTYDLAVNGDDLGVTPITLHSNPAHLLSIQPSLLFDVYKHLRVGISAEVPLLGYSYPTLPIVESLVGNRFQLEIRYGF